MKLTLQIFKIFSLIFMAQLLAVGVWAFYLYVSEKDGLPRGVVSSLTIVDKSILEGIILQDKIGNTISRDLIAYKLLELNNVDSASFLGPGPSSQIISELKLKDCKRFSDVLVCFKDDSNMGLSLIPLKLENKTQGYLKLEKSIKKFDVNNKRILLIIGVTVFSVFLINLFGLFTIWWKFLKPETERLLRSFDTQTEDPLIKIKEYRLVQDKFLHAVKKIKESEAAQVSLVTELQKVSMATQLAHDIRSPLEMLKGLRDELALLPESSRRRIQLGINRIEEIAFNLLKDYRFSIKEGSTIKSEELLSILEGVLSEKGIEFRKSEQIELKNNFGPQCYGVFSKIDRVSFKSLISNLINNAAESLIDFKGVVKVDLVSEFDRNIIKVTDNGSGIPADVASKLFLKGFTTKVNGNGLGLYNAKQDIEALGGSLTFTTEVGKGTTFTISLPRSEAPPTFVDAIHTENYEKIIILDDDPAFHEAWSKRFEGVENKLEHFYSISELLSKYQNLNSSTLLLSDFELMDKDDDGIDVIVRLNHAAHSILVTARSEEFLIGKRCLENGIMLLPKSMVNYVKVTSSLSNNKDQIQESVQGHQPVVLIDDDKLIRLNWSMYCEKKGLNFHAFSSIDEFLGIAYSFDKTIRVFIDSSLGDGIKGEIESEKIFNLGFRRLYLATGYEKESIQKPSWIIEVYSKSPEIIDYV